MFVNENAFEIRAASLLKTLIEQELPVSHDAAVSVTNAEFGGWKSSKLFQDFDLDSSVLFVS